MKFKTDENIPADAVALLCSAGYDTATVRDQSLEGQPDTKIALVCQQELWIVEHDRIRIRG